MKNIEIIKDTCELAHIPYPKAHTVNWEDQSVWEHIADSPVGIFQFESRFAYDSLKKFRCKKVNDLSLVNASIRPSGESYRDRLLAREENKNPSEIIDKLLKDNHGFLVFQEDTIKFLTEICGLNGSEADNIRRAIGRKQKDRLEATLPSILEGYCNKSDKTRDVAEQEAKAFLQIIEDSANYQFGFNHSTGYSMIGYMCGYLRYYYPKEFITAYLNNANNEDDIINGTNLAATLNIKVHPIKFRHSVAKYSCDNSGIYKGVNSVKFLNEKVANELYELKDMEFNSFLDLLMTMQKLSINSRQLDILVKLDFFSEFGNINQLLEQIRLFDIIYNKKQFKKTKIEELGISCSLVEQFAEKTTEKMICGVDSVSLLKCLSETTKNITTSLYERLKYELEHNGQISCVIPNCDRRLYCITDIKNTKSLIIVQLYEIYSGKLREVKMWKRQYERTTFDKGDILYITKLRREFQKEFLGKVDSATGKKIYESNPNKYEYWLDNFTIKNDIIG